MEQQSWSGSIYVQSAIRWPEPYFDLFLADSVRAGAFRPSRCGGLSSGTHLPESLGHDFPKALLVEPIPPCNATMSGGRGRTVGALAFPQSPVNHSECIRTSLA